MKIRLRCVIEKREDFLHELMPKRRIACWQTRAFAFWNSEHERMLLTHPRGKQLKKIHFRKRPRLSKLEPLLELDFSMFILLLFHLRKALNRWW